MPCEIEFAAERIATQLGVDARIHPADYIFWAIYDGRGERAAEDVVKEYFEGGRISAEHIKSLLGSRAPRGHSELLDFAGGYSRIARHLPLIMDKANITISDIHDDALRFARKLGFKTRKSTWHPENYRPGKFEMVIAISFFTHMPRETWVPWLCSLGRAVKYGGTLLFTTHGIPALKPMGIERVDDDGFGFFRQSEQADLDLENYASTVTLSTFVKKAIADAGLAIVEFKEGGFGYQDVWLVTRS